MMLESGGVETKNPRKRRLQELFYLSLIVCLSLKSCFVEC